MNPRVSIPCLLALTGLLLWSVRPLPAAAREALPTAVSTPSGGAGVVASDPFVRLPALPTSAAVTWLPAWGDYDDDGDIDLVTANAGTLEDPGRTLGLYRNRGEGTFDVITGTVAGDVTRVVAVWVTPAWADLDDDGFLDLLATSSPLGGVTPPPGAVFHNQGDGTFRQIGAGDFSGGRRGLWIMPPGDLNGDGTLDVLAIMDGAGESMHLYLGRGNGSFDRAKDTVFETRPVAPNLNFWADYDFDGDLDIFVPDLSGARRQDLLFRNEGGGRFTVVEDSPLLRTPGTTWHGAWGDYDQDGDFDCLLVKNGPPRLFRNDNGVFAPATVEGMPDTAGGAYWVDFDNDALVDLYLDRGQASASTNSLLRNLGDGRYEHVTSVLTTTRARRQGSAWGDIDNDGFLDVVEMVPTGGTRLYRNLGNTNHWLKLRLRGKSSNTTGIGATVKVRVTLDGRSLWQTQAVGGSTPGQGDLRPNFGLRDATTAEEVVILWPSGNVQTLVDVPANQILTVTEPVFFSPARPMATVNGGIAITHLGTATVRQWYFLGEPLPGETGATLMLPRVEASHAGRYSVVAQTADGTVTHHVPLRVDGTFTKLIDGELATEEFGNDQSIWFDRDRDGWLDVFIPNDYDYRGLSDSLFRNLGGREFLRITNSPVTVRPRGSTTASAADFDNDGWIDLFVNRTEGGPGELFRNLDGSQFVAVPGPYNLPHGQGFVSSWADYDRDGDLDLLVAYGYADQADPEGLYRNDGNGVFTQLDASQVGTLLSDRFKTWDCSWRDVDADGWADALIGHTSGLRLHRNTGDGRFHRVASTSLHQVRITTGFAWGDADNDGDPDLFVVCHGAGPAGLYLNQGNFQFERVPVAGDLVGTEFNGIGNPAWGDYDNDGYCDLFVARYSADGTQPSALYRNRGDGTFQRIEAGNLLTDGQRRVYPTWADIDNNGFLDLFINCGDFVVEEAPPVRNALFFNSGNGNGWLKVRLVGTTSNRDGLGAKVRVQATVYGRSLTQKTEITSEGGVPALAHFGLGDATQVSQVRIEWPSGIVQDLKNRPVNEVLTVTEPEVLRVTGVLTAEGLDLLCQGAPNTVYRFEGSANLRNWSSIATVTSDAQGAATTTVDRHNAAQFIRAVKP